MHIKSLVVSSLAVSLFLSFPAYSKLGINVDELLRTANLVDLLGNNEVLNLGAQTIDPNASSSSVDDLNDYIILGYPTASSEFIHAVEFDNNQKIINNADLGIPWLGVKLYKQSEIPNLSLQDGLQLAQLCMAAKTPPDPTPSTISRVFIYKTLNTLQVVYDYVFKDPNLMPGICREVLYTPATNTCERGYSVNCHVNYENVS